MKYIVYVFFFNDTATTEIYTLSLHDALPIWVIVQQHPSLMERYHPVGVPGGKLHVVGHDDHQLSLLHEMDYQVAQQSDSLRIRSEEHTSELQSRQYLVCRLLLEKKNQHTHPF